jgi:hypothetical protein
MAKVTAFLTVELDVTQQPVVEMARPSLEWGGFGARIDNLPYPCFRPRLLVNYVNLHSFRPNGGCEANFRVGRLCKQPGIGLAGLVTRDLPHLS